MAIYPELVVQIWPRLGTNSAFFICCVTCWTRCWRRYGDCGALKRRVAALAASGGAALAKSKRLAECGKGRRPRTRTRRWWTGSAGCGWRVPRG